MKKITLFLSILMFAIAQTWALPQDVTENSGIPFTGHAYSPWIGADVTELDFGETTLGNPVMRKFTVEGCDLIADGLTLTVEGHLNSMYEVTPSFISIEDAFEGVLVTVRCTAIYEGECPADLVISGGGAIPVIIPMNCQVNPSSNTISREGTLIFHGYVGWPTSKQVVNLRWHDAGIPEGPDPFYVGSAGGSDNPFGNHYSFSLEGDDCFLVYMTQCGETSKSCTLSIGYIPSDVGEHHATLTVSCDQAYYDIVISLDGIATEMPGNAGDLNGDGEICIDDVTTLIDGLILGTHFNSAYADVNGDGEVDINDVTNLIDLLLNK